MDIDHLRDTQKDNVRNSPFMAFKREGHNIVECAERFNITCKVESHLARMAGEPFDAAESEKARERARRRIARKSGVVTPRKPTKAEMERAASAKVLRDAREHKRAEILRYRLEQPDVDSNTIAEKLGMTPKLVAQYAREAGHSFAVHRLYNGPRRRPGDPVASNAPFKKKHAERNPALDAYFEKKRILRSFSNEANRTKAPITLPHVSILDGVVD